jgi:hypothetical protein
MKRGNFGNLISPRYAKNFETKMELYFEKEKRFKIVYVKYSDNKFKIYEDEQKKNILYKFVLKDFILSEEVQEILGFESKNSFEYIKFIELMDFYNFNHKIKLKTEEDIVKNTKQVFLKELVQKKKEENLKNEEEELKKTKDSFLKEILTKKNEKITNLIKNRKDSTLKELLNKVGIKNESESNTPRGNNIVKNDNENNTKNNIELNTDNITIETDLIFKVDCTSIIKGLIILK